MKSLGEIKTGPACPKIVGFGDEISERSKLLSQLDQAKMQEEMNSAMAQLTESVGADVPSLAEVQEKIQARYAKAKASAELTETSVESRVLEIEQATANVEAQSRLSELRAELGFGAPKPPRPSDKAPRPLRPHRPRQPRRRPPAAEEQTASPPPG